MVFPDVSFMAAQGQGRARTSKPGGNETGVHLSEKAEMGGNRGRGARAEIAGESEAETRTEMAASRLDLPAGLCESQQVAGQALHAPSLSGLGLRCLGRGHEKGVVLPQGH